MVERRWRMLIRALRGKVDRELSVTQHVQLELAAPLEIPDSWRWVIVFERLVKKP